MKQFKTHDKVALGMPAAAAVIGVPLSWVKASRDAGVQAFTSNGRVALDLVREWIEANPDKLPKDTGSDLSLRDQKLQEEIRKLKLANDIKEASVVSVAWLVNVISVLRADFDSIEGNLLKEVPTKHAEAGADVGLHRELLRRTFAEFRMAFEKMGEKLDNRKVDK